MVNKSHKPVQSLQRGLALLGVIARHRDGVNLKDLAAAIGCSSAAAYHLVHTLVDSGFVERREGPTRYLLGDGCLQLAEHRRQDRLYTAASSVMEQLEKALPGVVLYFCEWIGSTLFAHTYTPASRPGHLLESHRHPLPPYSSAGSLTHQAFWPPAMAEKFENLYPFAQYGLPFWRSRQAYEAALAQYRSEGLYLMPGEAPHKLKCALPLRQPNGLLFAALTLQWNHLGDLAAERPRLLAAAQEAAAAFTQAQRI